MKQINWSDHLLNFVAVILGVSLAFFVNDSAERKKQRDEYNQVVNSFLEEFRTDKITYTDYQIPHNRKQIESISEVLDLIQTSENDSLFQKFEKSLGINNYFPSSVTFNSLKNAGKLDLIDDFEIRKALSTYHTVYVEEARMRGQLQVDFYMNQLMPWILEHTDFINPSAEAISQKELVNTLIIYQSFIKNKLDHYEYMVKLIGDLEEDLVLLKE